VLDHFDSFNKDKPYAEQIKPFNFMMALSQHPFFKRGDDTASFIAPYEPNPSRWHGLPWLNYRTNEAVILAAPEEWIRVVNQSNVICPVKFINLLHRYLRHIEPNFLAFDGTVCEEETTGVLRRRPVTMLSITHIGKETNEIRNISANAGLDDDSPIAYDSSDAFWFDVVLPVIRFLPRDEVARQLEVTRRTVERWIAGEVKPSERDKRRAIHRLDILLCEHLSQLGIEPQDVVANLTAFPVVLAARRILLKDAIGRLEQQYGQRGAARVLKMTRSMTAKYCRDDLPAHATTLVAISARVSATLDRLGLTEKGQSAWATLEIYASGREDDT
jgi:hypothetical protein